MTNSFWKLFTFVILIIDFTITNSLHTKSTVDTDRYFDELHNILPDLELPRLKLPRFDENVKTRQRAIEVIHEGMDAIGKQLGLPSRSGNLFANHGNGTVSGMKARASEAFNSVNMHGIEDVVNFMIEQIGQADGEIDLASAFDRFSMVAERVGAKSFATQFAPLIHATSTPNPTVMFNLLGNMLAKLNVPSDSLEFIQKLGAMYHGGSVPSPEEERQLVKMTIERGKNRTKLHAGPNQKRKFSIADYYKMTSNFLAVSFKLPCAFPAKVCFMLNMICEVGKRGPGFHEGKRFAPTSGVMNFALGIHTQTEISSMHTPFYFHKWSAVGAEHTLLFDESPFTIIHNDATKINLALKLRDSFDCMGSGSGKSIGDPRLEFCPYASTLFTGGDPQMWMSLELAPMRNVGTDTFMLFYDAIKAGGEIGAPELQSVPTMASYNCMYRAL